MKRIYLRLGALLLLCLVISYFILVFLHLNEYRQGIGHLFILLTMLLFGIFMAASKLYHLLRDKKNQHKKSG